MNFNFTEEQAKTPVTYGDLAVFLNEMFKFIEKEQKAEHETIEHVLQSLTNVFVERMNKIQYNQIRDTKFFIALLSDLGYGSNEYITQYYNSWCAEFDKLNKEVLNDAGKTNC